MADNWQADCTVLAAARIIDPKAWANLDRERERYPADPLHRFLDEPFVEASITKARQVFALTTTPA